MNLLLTFIILSFIVIIIPGPNVLLIVSTSILHGKSRGLQTVAGTSLAMALQLIIAGLSTSWFIQILSDGFYLLKWVGVAYLFYLGIVHIKDAFDLRKENNKLTASATFSRGFFVSLTNPKTILFFSAFLPQFVTSPKEYMQQITILSISFLFLAIVLDSGYAVLSAKCKLLIDRNNLCKIQNGFSALLFLGASAWLAMSRRV